MSSTNGTANPFAPDTTGAQAGLYKGIGVSLAVASGMSMQLWWAQWIDDWRCSVSNIGVFIGSSFVFKKKGLLQSIEKSGTVLQIKLQCVPFAYTCRTQEVLLAKDTPTWNQQCGGLAWFSVCVTCDHNRENPHLMLPHSDCRRAL